MLYEVRNYHFRPDLFADYKAWAKDHAIPYLSTKLEVLGFWVNTDAASEINGAPLDALGSANITWILKWRDMEHRNAGIAAALSGPEWEAVFAKVPGGISSYLRTESKFTEALV